MTVPASGNTGIRIKYVSPQYIYTQLSAATLTQFPQANPITCAGSLAVQKVIAEQDLLSNIRKQGDYLASLLRSKLQSPNAPAAPFTFDIRGGAGFWGIEFDFEGVEAAEAKGYDGKVFAIEVQAKALENGLIIMGFTGGASLDGLKGNHCMLSPAYNITTEEMEKIYYTKKAALESGDKVLLHAIGEGKDVMSVLCERAVTYHRTLVLNPLHAYGNFDSEGEHEGLRGGQAPGQPAAGANGVRRCLRTR